MSLKQNERPVASILTKLKDDDRAMVIHRKKLAATKPMVDTGKPSTQKYKHLKQNLKGKQLEADRNLDVERENRSLVGRLMYIMNNSVFEEELFGLDRHISYRPVSMNYKNRMDTMRQIEAENLAMMKRLISRNGKSDLNKHTLKPDPFHPPHLFETKNRMLLPRLHLERTMTRDGLLSPNKTGSAAGSPRSPPKSAPSTNQGGEEGFFESKTARYAPSQALGNEGGVAPTDRTAPAALGDDGSSSHGPVTDRLKPQAPAGAPKRGRPGGRAGRVAGGVKPQPPARAGRGGGGAGRPQANPGAAAAAAPGRASPPGAKLVLCKEGVKVSNVYVTLTVSAQRGGEPVLEVYEPLASLHLGFPVPRGALARLASAEQVKAMCTPRHPQAPALWKGLVAPQLELVQGAAAAPGAAAPALRLVAADAARTVLAASAGAGAAGGAAGPPPDTPNTANIKSISHQYVQQQVGEAMRRASLESTAEARAGPPAGAELAEPAAEVDSAQQEQEIDDAASHISQTAQSLEGEGQEDNEEEEEEDYGDDYEESEGNDEAAAAAKIQAVARGSAGRKEVAAMKEEHAQEDAAAAKIQAVARGSAGRKEVAAMKEEHAQEDAAAAKIQAVARGSAGRKEAAAKKEEHAQEDAAAAKIQAVARGSAGRKEAAAKKEEAVAQEASGEASGDYAEESFDAEGRKEAAAKKEVVVAQDASGEASGDYGDESFDAEG